MRTVSPAGGVAPSSAPAGTIARVNPSRAASASRRPTPDTVRISPASPTSPIATSPRGSGTFSRELTAASASARSAAGSITRAPPMVDTYTSWSASRAPSRRWSTASTMASRLLSTPLVVRRGLGTALGATSDCTSTTSGRRPSSVTVRQVPGTACSAWEMNSPLGSASPTIPDSDRSKQPTSSVGPYRFLVARSMRRREWRSPSNWQTTSTRCSSVRGPATEPSLVTWPMSTTGMSRAFAAWITARGHLAHLGHPARGALDLRGRDRLDGVEHQQVGVDLLDVPEDRAEVGLRGEQQLGVERVDPARPQAHLRGRLLAGHVQHLAPGAGRAGGDVEQQGRLADARLAGQQHHGAGHEAAAEHPVQLVDPRGPRPRGLDVDLVDGPGRRPRGRGGDRARCAAAGPGVLEDRAPGLALAAPAHPLGGGPPALGAAERGTRAAVGALRGGRGHAPHASRRV